MAKPRLLLADDHELLTDGLRRLLEPEFDLVAVVSDGRAAVTEYERLLPDVALLDIGMEGLNGVECARQIKARFPGARIIFVTMQTDRAFIDEAWHVGASGYVVKQSAGGQLLEAIRTVLHGRRYLSPQLAEKMGAPAAETTSPVEHVFGARLTPRQREVLQLVAEGKSMKDMARILHISVRTVEFHKSALIQQLGIRTVAELTRYAMAQKIAM